MEEKAYSVNYQGRGGSMEVGAWTCIHVGYHIPLRCVLCGVVVE